MTTLLHSPMEYTTAKRITGRDESGDNRSNEAHYRQDDHGTS